MKRALVLLGMLVATSSAHAQSEPAQAERLALDATHGIAPQPPRVADLYRRARPVREARFRGMWLCEAAIDGDGWDGNDPNGPVRRYMGRVELDVAIAIPRRADVVRFRGPDDTNRIAFAVAGVDVATGEKVRFELSDRDVLSNDPIAQLELTYDGSLPIRGEAEHASIECRGMTEDSLASRIDDAIEEADDELDELDAISRPDRAVVGFRDPDASSEEAMLAVYEIARYTGLGDPRFLERRDALRTRDAAYLASVASMVRDLHASATPVGTSVTLTGTSIDVVVDDFDCVVEDVIELHSELGLDVPMDCVMRLTIRNRGDATTFGWAMHLVDDLGETTPVVRFATVDAEGIHRTRTLRLPSGETRLVVACPSRRALLLRLSKRRTLVWSRTTGGPSHESDPRLDFRRRSRDRASPSDPVDTM